MEDSKIARDKKETFLTAEEANYWLNEGAELMHKEGVERIEKTIRGRLVSTVSSYQYEVTAIYCDNNWKVYKWPLEKESKEEHTYKRKSLLNWRRSE